MKRLVIEEIPNAFGDIDRIRIVEQTHRNSHFTDSIPKGSIFKYKDFTLCSSVCPQISPNMLYVRGCDDTADYIILGVPSQEWLERMRATVDAYNTTFCNCKECEDRHCNGCKYKKGY